MENSLIEVECPECSGILMDERKLDLLKMEREASKALRGETTKDIVDDIQELNKDIDVNGLNVTPSINTLGKYDIDTNTRLRDVNLVLQSECDCGESFDLKLKTDYSRPITVDFEVNPIDNS